MATLALPEEYRLPLEKIDLSDASLHHRNVAKDYLARLRREDPVHLCADSKFGPYWSITKFHDIMHVDMNHQLFSSAGSVVFDDNHFSGGNFENEIKKPSFIVSDPPFHTEQRRAVSPALAPGNILKLQDGIRQRARKTLDELPIGETFDWVNEVAVELTTQLLAILFDFPFEERRKLLFWSHVSVGFPGDGVVESWEHRSDALKDAGAHFLALREARRGQAGRPDLISMMANSESMRDMTGEQFVGNVFLLMVGGNDTTRNSMTASVLAMHQFPEQLARLKGDPALLASMVPEVIRWQSPVVYQRRTATADTEIRGKMIRKGDKVVMWYLSGNRDEDIYENPDDFVIDRPNPRQHLSFGFGIHRCLGNRLAEMQLRILWEEILERFSRIEVMGEPERINSNVLRGYTALPVRLHR
ncbi:cytochrome P450 [Rhizorhabdus dicambivorans]|uniref:cytochrome P450 n=1 Tax=Rhizorhabdus dicambivorans TaxID=1850238 RepID=UPI000AC8A796|nr:cytochrome P450 [Rhizorhabdus dicambivorans]